MLSSVTYSGGYSAESQAVYQTGNYCQAEIFRVATFEERLVAAFNGDGLKRIAERLGVNYHTLRNWAKETRPIPPEMLKQIATLTNVSLNWLLLEDGPRTVQQLGFDLDYSVTRNESWREVLEEWYDFEGRIMPDFGGVAFMGGWGSLTHKQRIGAISDLKQLLDKTLAPERLTVADASGKVAARIEPGAKPAASNRDIEYLSEEAPPRGKAGRRR